MKDIVWLGPMGDDSVTKKAVDLRDYGIRDLCTKYGFSLVIANTIEATNWFEQLKNILAMGLPGRKGNIKVVDGLFIKIDYLDRKIFPARKFGKD